MQIEQNLGYALSIIKNNSARPEALPPPEHFFDGQKAVFPTDLLGDGTWFAVADDWVLALLNGGFEKHIRRKEGYRRSRGGVILDFLRSKSLETFEKTFDTRGMEPFTLVVFDQKTVRSGSSYLMKRRFMLARLILKKAGLGRRRRAERAECD